MNSNITIIENYCRTCMHFHEEDSVEDLGKKRSAISIFSTPDSMDCKNTTIMELLISTTPELNIERGDMLPKNVCKDCVERLINTYEFQKTCIRVEKKLREMINETPLEFPISKDPLKEISTDGMGLVQSINDFTHVVKIEIDEPLIDQNEIKFGNGKLIDDITLKKGGDILEDMSDSDVSNDNDSGSEWEIQPNNVKSKRGKKIVSTDIVKVDDFTDEQTSKDYTKNYKTSKIDESKRFECDKCGNYLSTRKSLKRHQRIHLRTNGVEHIQTLNKAKDAGSKNFECDECGNRLSTRKSLKRHKRIHLRTVLAGQKNVLVKSKYECEFCQKVFQQSSSLKDHLRKHTGEQPYLCSECGKAFKSLSNMKQHFLRHGTERPYVCPDCPRTFPCLSDLSSHKAVHNKIKSHVCDICGAAFVKPYLLKKHNMYHTGEKNHKCDYCDMRFVVADHCRRHMRTHTGEKPYKCKYCERAFAQSNDLTKHLRGHLGDNVYKCGLCPQGFRLQGDLRTHFYTHKNDDDETRARNLQALRDEENKLQIKFGLLKCT